MVDGIGTDIIEIDRVARAIGRTRTFEARIYTEAEIAYCRSRGKPYQHFAGRFAAKEAVIKALGRSVPWHEIEILNDTRGKPICTLHGQAAQIAGPRRILVSISHCELYCSASAIAVIERLHA